MRGKTHLAAGLLIATLVTDTPAQAGLLIFGSLLPDVDLATSMLGKKVPLPRIFITHRGVTHSLVAAALAAVLNPFVSIGMLSHDLLDILNPKGVMLLWPGQRFYSIARIACGGILDWILFLLLGAASALILFT